MGDMREKVARAAWPYWRTEGNAGPLPHDLPWDDGSDIAATEKEKAEVTALVCAALEACHFEELVEALEVYAKPDNWQEMTGEFLVYEPDDDDRIVFDAGQIARAVLAKVEASDA